MEKHAEQQMETVDKKGPPPSYANDSDVESIIKPEHSIFEEKEAKPLPAWRNNIFLRTNRRALITGGLLGTAVILAIVLGLLKNVGIIGHPDNKQAGYCRQWAYRTTLASRSSIETPAAYASSDVYCAVQIESGASGNIVNPLIPTAFVQSDESCVLWVSDILLYGPNGFVANPAIDWRCIQWDANATSVATITATVSPQGVPAASPTAGRS